jgi:hypothetical protein
VHTQRDAQPAYYFLGAANSAIERRRAAQRAHEAAGAAADAGTPAPAHVAPGEYVGQFVARGAAAAAGQPPEAPRRLSDEDFLRFLQARAACTLTWLPV